MVVQVSLWFILMRKKERQLSTTWRTALLLEKSLLLRCLGLRKRRCKKVFRFITLVLREDLRIDLSSISDFVLSFLSLSFGCFLFHFFLFFSSFAFPCLRRLWSMPPFSFCFCFFLSIYYQGVAVGSPSAPLFAKKKLRKKNLFDWLNMSNYIKWYEYL